jgi:hypothetical protein
VRAAAADGGSTEAERCAPAAAAFAALRPAVAALAARRGPLAARARELALVLHAVAPAAAATAHA